MKKFAFLFSLFLLLGVFLFVGKDAVFAGYGEAASAPTCNNEKPAKPWLYKAEAVGVGGVDLFWDKTDKASSWTVAYGVRSGVYVYGIDRFGDANSRSIRISNLPAGKYYFVIRANNGCMPGPFSNEWAVTVGRGAAVAVPVAKVTPAPGAPIITPKVTPTPGVRYVPPTEPRVTVSPVQPPIPTPAPQPGIFQRIVNFFLGLFGVR